MIPFALLFFALVAQPQGKPPPVAATDSRALAMTPPMGWNSWNAFEKDIDETKIKAIADAMVSSGMRDAGYIYVVLDDAWMAKERDSQSHLVADPVKFPSGMKAIGDYIHSKGLKFGIYEDRGRLTCQQLPGSSGHEQIDMQTFADWGVDYIKMDSCFAEANGRFSSEHYQAFRKFINATGRPMILSISDFGNGAWAWGGKESSQLWRTSYDIYPYMDSVYSCAESSTGSGSIHPAFNGLWQFAGPGHWNDPDMLEVGNLKDDIPADRKIIADRAHFSLWCIMAAPLMAGTDLRTLNNDVRNTLTAPEVIAVDQDKRGIQGYKVFSDGGVDIYNKPLADGTTAVLMLNKGKQKSTVTIRWRQIGLSGTQSVRNLWERKNLGNFKDAFSVELGTNEHRLLKIGRTGRPLPTPKPIPTDKYTVSRKGVTYLSDLYYVWKSWNAPVYDSAYDGKPIEIDGKTYKKGLGCKGKCAVMFQLNCNADQFRAVVSLNRASQGVGTGRFYVFNGDFFSNRLLWDSGPITASSPGKEVDIAVKDVQCLRLVFEGENLLGNWAEARVIRNDRELPIQSYK